MTEQPSTAMTAMSHETTGFCFCGQMHGPVKDWNEHDWAALRTHAPAGALSAQPVSLPTREQIAQAHRYQEGDAGDGYTEPREWWAQCSCGVWLKEWQQFYNESDDNPHEAYALHLVDAVLALLSQPTPTAAVDRCPSTVSHAPHEWNVNEGEVGFGSRCPGVADPDDDESGWPEPHDLPPEPPRIEDLAPGTTFTEASNGWPRTAWTVGQRHDGTKYVKRQSDGWVLEPKGLDPSTIRDVTPPKGDDHA